MHLPEETLQTVSLFTKHDKMRYNKGTPPAQDFKQSSSVSIGRVWQKNINKSALLMLS